jgi:hypothetical protein
VAEGHVRRDAEGEEAEAADEEDVERGHAVRGEEPRGREADGHEPHREPHQPAVQPRPARRVPRAGAGAEADGDHRRACERCQTRRARVLGDQRREDRDAGRGVGEHLAVLARARSEVDGRRRAGDHREDEAADADGEAEEDALPDQQLREPHHRGGHQRGLRQDDQRRAREAVQQAERDQHEGRRRTALRAAAEEPADREADEKDDQAQVGRLGDHPPLRERRRW